MPWSTSSFITAVCQEEQQGQEQDGGKKCPKMSPALSLPPTFTRGSYRRYMNHLIRSNFSEKLHVKSPVKSTNVSSIGSRLQKFRDNVCYTHNKRRNNETTEETSIYVHDDYGSSSHEKHLPVEKRPVTTVPGGDVKNYIVSNRTVNSRVGRLKSLVSLSPRVGSGVRGAVLPTTNGVETDGGVVVDSKGDAPSSAPCRSFKHPSSSGCGIAHQSDAEDEETSTYEKCSIKEMNKGRQRKTGAFAGGRSHSAGAEQEIAATATQTSAVLRFPCVGELIHKYTVMITEQKERVLAEKQVENQSRGKQKQGNIENHSTHQYRGFSGSSTKQTVQSQPVHKSEHTKQPTEQVQVGGPAGQVTTESSDLGECSGVSKHLKHDEYVIDPVGDSARQNDDHEVPAEHSTKCVQQYGTEPVQTSAGQLQQKELRNIARLHNEEDFMTRPVLSECLGGRAELQTNHLQHSHSQSCVTRCHEQSENHGFRSTISMKYLGQSKEHSSSFGHNTKIHPEQEITKDSVNIVQSQHCNNVTEQDPIQLEQVCHKNSGEGTDLIEQNSESLTSLFMKPSKHVSPNISHVGGTTVSTTGDEGHRNLTLPRVSERSVSPASDEGCSLVPPPESSLTPYSSEDDIVRSLVEKSTTRWTWPPVSYDQDSELQVRAQRREYGRCGSSDSAVCLLPCDDEGRIQMKEPGVPLRQASTDSRHNISDFVASEDSSCDKAMVFDRYMNKTSDFSFDSDTVQYVWRHGSSSEQSRRDSDMFPGSSIGQSSVDIGDTWFEEVRCNTKEAMRDDVCDSGIDRDIYLASTEAPCWDLSSVEEKTDAFSPEGDRFGIASPTNYGYSCRYRRREFRKVTSMTSCESGVVEDEDCSRKSSTTEGAENPDDDEYLVELRRQSAQSFQTDDDESIVNPQYRYWRTPSVVVSDYSDDVPCFTSVTLEELEQLKDLSSSECASGRSSVSGIVGGSVPDTEFSLRTPERKASDCSTCSTLSGDEDTSCDALLQPVRTKQKVGRQVILYFTIHSLICKWIY